MPYQSELETQVVSVRIHRQLLQRIDRYAREQALKRDARISRNSIISELLESALNHSATTTDPQQEEDQP